MMDAISTYRENDFNRGFDLLRQLGSFWVNIFEDRENLQTLLRGSVQVQSQTHLNMLETIATLSRFTVPVFHTENWYLMTVRQSDVDTTMARYGPDDLLYGDGHRYGGPDDGFTVVPLPAELVDLPFVIQNLVVYPSKVWVNGIDYSLNKQHRLIEFRRNPFLDPLVPKQDIVDSKGVKIDEEIALWVYKGQFDLSHMYLQFGYAIGVKLESSQGYNDLVNAIWDSYVLGGSLQNLELIMSTVAGAQTVIDSEEIVEVVRVESTRQVIVTNTRVYTASLNANVIVAVGDTVYSGDPLTDALEVSELSKKDPDYSILPAMSLSKSFLSGGYIGELTFKNHTVALDYLGQDSDGRTIVRFETSGYPADVETFWDMVHTLGKDPSGWTTGKTLANLLDKRTAPTTEPGPLALPTTVNPMQFVLQNLMRNNLFLMRFRLSSFDDDAPGVEFLRVLRNVIPPHTSYIVFIELSPDLESVDLSQAGDSEEPGVSESHTNFLSASVSDSADEASTAMAGTASYQDGNVTVKYVCDTCE